MLHTFTLSIIGIMNCKEFKNVVAYLHLLFVENTWHVRVGYISIFQ